MTNYKFLAIDAGGTFFKYALLDKNCDFLSEVRKIAVNEKGTASDIVNTYNEIFSEFNDYSFVTVSTPGPFDYKNGVSLMQHKFQSLYKFPLKAELENLTNSKICFLSDSNAFLLGESTKGFYNAIGITIGTGLGFSAITDGKIRTDKFGGPCEKIYCLPYKDAIAEDYISGRGIETRYEKATGKCYSAKKIAEIAEKGDNIAVKTYEDMGEAIGNVLTPYVEKYKSKALIIGGQVARSLNLFEDKIKLGIPVYASQNVTGSALIGAANYAKEYFKVL